MKLVFLSAGAGGGGAEEVLFDLVTSLRLDHPDWKITVICGETGSLIARLRDKGVSVEPILFPKSILGLGEQPGNRDRLIRRAVRLLSLFSSFFSLLIYSWRIRRRIRELAPDIVHSNGVKMHVVSALANSSGKLIWHVHDYIGQRRISSRLLPWIGGRAHLLCNSADVMRDCQKLFKNGRVQVLENPVNTDRFQPEGARADLDQLAGFAPAAPGTLKVGLVATFAKWKGQMLFLQAISLLPPSLPVRFYIIGGPIYATPGSQWTVEEMQEAAKKLPYPIGLTGWIEDAPSAFRALDICIHASTRPEPFGLVIAQAMASGRAVIVSDEGGAAEVVEGCVPALKFEPRHAESLASVMQRLIHDPKRRAAALVLGPVHVKERFGKSRFIQRVNDYLQALIAIP